MSDQGTDRPAEPPAVLGGPEQERGELSDSFQRSAAEIVAQMEALAGRQAALRGKVIGALEAADAVFQLLGDLLAKTATNAQERASFDRARLEFHAATADARRTNER